MSFSSPLLSSLQIGPYELRNRMIMSAMTRSRALTGGVPGPLNVDYYTQRSSAGLIVTEASHISLQGAGSPGTPGIYSAAQVSGWRTVTDSVHAEGGRIFLQLWHAGRVSHPLLQPGGGLPVAPSAIAPAGETETPAGPKPFATPRELGSWEIPLLLEQYRVAARNAKLAGFDGVEIHSGYGFLLDQFLRDHTNQRADIYGGSVENRARLLLEVTNVVCDVWGADRVGVKLTPSSTIHDMSDSDPGRTFGYTIKQLNKCGLAYLAVVQPNEHDLRHGGVAIPIEFVRTLYRGVLIANGGLDRVQAESLLDNGDADAIAFGRLFLANPDLPRRFSLDSELNVPDRATFYVGGANGYTDYLALEDHSLLESAMSVGD